MTFRGSLLFCMGTILQFVLFVFAKVDGGFLSWFLFYVFIVLFLYEFTSKWLTMRNLFISRSISTNHLSASQSLDVEIVFTRNHFWPMFWAKVSDNLPNKLSIRASHSSQMLIPLWNRQLVCKYRITDLPRGIHHLDEIQVESGDLLSLQKFTKIYNSYQQIVVYPRIVPVRGWRSIQVKESGGRHSISRRAEESANVIGVRQYMPGDKLSRIHWPLSARTGFLQSKEFEQHVMSDYIFIPDASRASFSKKDGDDLFDLEMTISASLMKYALDTRRRFGATIHSNRLVRFEPSRDQSLFLSCMETLAELDPVCQTPFALSVERMTKNIPSGCTYVIISPELTRKMAFTVSRVRKRGFVEWFVPLTSKRMTEEEAQLIRNLQENRIVIHFIGQAEQLSVLGRGGRAFATES